jgi:pimeloyl-ACP methyl ester carboxylesterase
MRARIPNRHPELVSGLVLVAPALPTVDRASPASVPGAGGLRQLLRLAATRALLAADGPGLHYVRRQVERRRRELQQVHAGRAPARARVL